MKRLCRFAAFALVFGCTVLARATPTDDFKMDVLDPPATSFPTYPITFNSFRFQFTACQAGELPGNNTGDGCFAGVNRTGTDWTSIQFTFPNDSVLNGQPTDCSGARTDNIFSQATCGHDQNIYTLVYAAGTLHNNDIFFLVETGVPADQFPIGTATVLTSTTSTPEPSTLLLLGTGVGMALFAWKLQR